MNDCLQVLNRRKKPINKIHFGCCGGYGFYSGFYHRATTNMLIFLEISVYEERFMFILRKIFQFYLYC